MALEIYKSYRQQQNGAASGGFFSHRGGAADSYVRMSDTYRSTLQLGSSTEATTVTNRYQSNSARPSNFKG